MAQVIDVASVIDMIEKAQTEFAVQSVRKFPTLGDGQAMYQHGVYVGMETVKSNILKRVKESESVDKPENAAGGARRGSAY